LQAHALVLVLHPAAAVTCSQALLKTCSQASVMDGSSLKQQEQRNTNGGMPGCAAPAAAPALQLPALVPIWDSQALPGLCSNYLTVRTIRIFTVTASLYCLLLQPCPASRCPMLCLALW
jgi:hypothetical protein